MKPILKAIMASPVLVKAAVLLNRLLISSLGVRVVPEPIVGLDADWFKKLLYYQRLLGSLEDVEGDVVECGVAAGHSLAMLAGLVRAGRIDRHIWGFDSWSGLPEPDKEDLASAESVAEKGMFTHSVKDVLATLRWYGFDDSQISNSVTLVKGLFAETLPTCQVTRITLLHIDADIYESYSDSLRYLWPKVSVGGIVAFDEYQEPARWPGARKAVDDFLSQLVEGSARLCQDALYDRYYAVKLTT